MMVTLIGQILNIFGNQARDLLIIWIRVVKEIEKSKIILGFWVLTIG